MPGGANIVASRIDATVGKAGGTVADAAVVVVVATVPGVGVGVADTDAKQSRQRYSRLW